MSTTRQDLNVGFSIGHYFRTTLTLTVALRVQQNFHTAVDVFFGGSVLKWAAPNAKPHVVPERIAPRVAAKITVGVEREVDFALTCILLNRAFPGGYGRDQTYLKWQHELSGDKGSINVAAFKAGQKVGQMSLLRHPFLIDRQRVDFGFIADFFVLPEHRSGPLTIKLAKELRAAGVDGGVSRLYGVPNAASLPVVSRFLNGERCAALDMRVGLSTCRESRAIVFSGGLKGLGKDRLADLLDPYLQAQNNGRYWTGASLAVRLDSPVTQFAAHATDDVLALSTRQLIKGVPAVLICGFLSRTGLSISPKTVNRVIAAACRHHLLPQYVYVGRNDLIASLPGLPIPDKFRPSSPMTVVSTLAGEAGPPMKLDRYELIDFDIV